MRPLERLPLCGIAMSCPPVFASYAAIQSWSFSGASLFQDEKGNTWSALSFPSRKMTLRCRLLPPGTVVHS